MSHELKQTSTAQSLTLWLGFLAGPLAYLFQLEAVYAGADKLWPRPASETSVDQKAEGHSNRDRFFNHRSKQTSAASPAAITPTQNARAARYPAASNPTAGNPKWITEYARIEAPNAITEATAAMRSTLPPNAAVQRPRAAV